MTTYNRFLDIHLCAEATGDVKNKFPPDRNSELYFGVVTSHFYEFSPDLMRQRRYRESKAEGFNFSNDNKGNCKILDKIELTDATDPWLELDSTFDTSGSPVSCIKDGLKQLRYVGCMVSIEKLKQNVVEQQLQALMLWISDPATQNKLRINCHGSGTSTGGMSMAAAKLSAAELVSALVLNGLTRPSSHAASASGLAQNARWKLDEEKDSCEGCRKKFGVFTRKHHCRRCGGLFCDKCSSKKMFLAVALTGEERGKVIQQTATASNVNNARVCDACFAFVESKGAATTGRTDYGLKTLTLALCMGARADDKFSGEVNSAGVGTFVRDSLASRVLTELRTRNLRGIKVTASNQVLAGTAEKGILAECGVKHPSNPQAIGYDVSANAAVVVHTKGTEFENNNATFSMPAYIWGSKQKLKTQYDAGQKLSSSDITLSPCKRSLYFSMCSNPTELEVAKQYLDSWKFTSWQTAIFRLPIQFGNALNSVGPASRRQAISLTTNWTWRITAPPRVAQMSFQQKAGTDSNTISITGRGTESFKHYKSYEVS